MRTCSFTSASLVLVLSIAFIKHQKCPFVKHFFLSVAESVAESALLCYDMENEKSQQKENEKWIME